MNPLLFGKYCLLERVSVGGMAEVFRAKPFDVPDFRGYLALKRILPHLAEDEEFIKMFVDEAKLTVQLDHPNIVRIFELGQFQHSYYILMEYISGKDLLALQKTMRKQRNVMPADMSMFIAREMARGLHYAHHRRDSDGNPLNIIHRDVSPQNVLIDYRGNVKVIDFGIAKAAVQSTRTQVGVLKGKMGYMSPEQVRGEPLDFRSDVFAIGTVLWEMLTNRRLFNAENEFETMQLVRDAVVPPPSAKNAELSPEIDEIVLKALTANPEERYDSAGAFAERIDAWLAANAYDAQQLSIWMRTVFADDLEEERAKRQTFNEIRSPADVRRRLEASTATVEEESEPVVGESSVRPTTEDAIPKTEIWDADIVPDEGEDLAAFAAQHTVVQAGGFDASMVADTEDIETLEKPKRSPQPHVGLDSLQTEPHEDERTEDDGPDLGLSAAPPVAAAADLPPMRATAPAKATIAPYAAESTNPGAPPAAAPPPKALAVVGAISVLMFLTGAVALVAFYGLGLGNSAEVPAQGTLVVNVTPPTGIEVLVDGKAVANAAPVTLENVASGPHVVEVRAAEHENYRETVNVAPGGLTPVNVGLVSTKPPEGALVLRLPDDREGAKIYVDGERQSYQNEENPAFTVPAGRHLFEVLRPGFRPWVRIVEVGDGVRKEEVVRFVPQRGDFTIKAPESASVYWDRKRIGVGEVTATDVDPHEVHDLRVTGDQSWQSAVGFPELGKPSLTVDFGGVLPPTHRKGDFGWLQISTGDDWWEVLIDGVETGFATPITPSRKLPIARGKHTITFRRGDTRHEREITIERGETVILRESLDYEWRNDG